MHIFDSIYYKFISLQTHCQMTAYRGPNL